MAQASGTPDYVTEDQIGSLFTSGGSTTPVVMVEPLFPSQPYEVQSSIVPSDGIPCFFPSEGGQCQANAGVIVSAAYNLGNGLYLYAYEIDTFFGAFAATTLSVPLGGAPLIPDGAVTTGAFSAGNFPLQFGLPNFGIPEPTFTGVLAPFWFVNPGCCPEANSTIDGITGFTASGAQITFTALGANGSELYGLPSIEFTTPVFGFITNVPPIVLTGQFAADANGTLLRPAFPLVVPADPQLVDPVPGLLNGSTATTDANTLATQGRSIAGVAADGVTEAVLRIPTTTVGDQVTLTIQNFTSADEMGALGDPLAGDTQFTKGTLTVSAVGTTTNGPMAFAIYRAPTDFVRGSVPEDANAAARPVNLNIQASTAMPSSTVTLTETVAIVRPPVVLVHGLWGSPSAWNNFSPLFSAAQGPDPRFSISLVDYSAPLGTDVSATDPDYGSPLEDFVLLRTTFSALGLSFNAPYVLDQVDEFLGAFKGGGNPARIAVAAIQADIVAHSMGGDVVREVSLLPEFLSDETYGHGSVHKLVTVGSPHLGTPLATDLLQDANSCVRTILAVGGNPSFVSVTATSGIIFSGGVGDVQGAGIVGGSLSPGLARIENATGPPIPTALVAGTESPGNLASLDTCFLCLAPEIRGGCDIALRPEGLANPLAQAMTSAGWPTLFPGPSDAIVPQTSQLDGVDLLPVPGLIHSTGLVPLGFTGPAELDSESGISAEVTGLLNTPITASTFLPLP